MSGTNEDFEQRIRERAYGLWEAEGRPEGRAEEFWERARRELDDDGAAASEEAEEQNADAEVKAAAE